mgnify:CR=1 FL=1
MAVFAAASFAGVQDFGKFTIDVPEGWTAAQSNAASAVTRDDNMAQVTFTISDTEGKSLNEIIDMLVTAYKANGFTDITTPEPDKDSEGYYSFNSVNPYGAACIEYVKVVDDEVRMISIVIAKGHEEDSAGVIQEMLDSVKMK